MAVMRTYQGVVRKGNIRITPPFDLPEGSEVYVVATGRNAAETAVSTPLHTSPNRAAMLQEQAAYQTMLPELLAAYENQYVAVYQANVIDHDSDKIALSMRLDETHPDAVVLVRQVTAAPDRVLQMSSPRLARTV